MFINKRLRNSTWITTENYCYYDVTDTSATGGYYYEDNGVLSQTLIEENVIIIPEKK